MIRTAGVLRAACIAAVSGLFLTFPTLAHPSGPHVHRGSIVPMKILVGPTRPMSHAIYRAGHPMGAIDFHIEPEETTVTVDDLYRGTAGAFDGVRGSMLLPPGTHRITLQNPEGETWSEKVRILPGQAVAVEVELQN